MSSQNAARLWLLALAAAGVLVTALVSLLVPVSAEAVERRFSLGVYPPMQRVVTGVTNYLPFTLFDALVIFVTLAAVMALVQGAGRARRERSARPLAWPVIGIVSGAALAYLVFLVLWGLNYRRVPMESRLALEEGPVSTEAVVALGLEAVQQLNSLHEEAHRLGWNEPEWRSAALRSSAAEVQARLTGLPGATPGRLKQTLFGRYFRWTGVDGMVNPFGLEVLANPDLLPFERPFVAAHEWAHLAGFAHEAEANFVGFLTCVGAEVPAQYSGWLYLYWQIAGETDRVSRTRLWDAMDAGPRSDVTAVIARLRQGELPRLRVASWFVYDQYLKANRVESGVRSYGEVVNLLVRARFERGWVPVRKAEQPLAGS